MLVESELRNLSHQDLNQRYAGTWIKYNGVVINVAKFGLFEGKTVIQTTGHRAREDDLNILAFDYKLLDISRPKARWVWYKGTFPLYCSYRPVRQFKRGLHVDNVAVFHPIDGEGRWHLDNDIAVALFSPDDFDTAEAVTSKGLHTAILNDYIAMSKDNLFVLTEKVGIRKGDTLFLKDGKFKQEFLDLGFKKIETDFKLKTPPPAPKRKLLVEDRAPAVNFAGAAAPRFARAGEDELTRALRANVERAERVVRQDRERPVDPIVARVHEQVLAQHLRIFDEHLFNNPPPAPAAVEIRFDDEPVLLDEEN